MYRAPTERRTLCSPLITTIRKLWQRPAKANWRIEDIISSDESLDLNRPFMPESLARVQLLDFLSEEEKILLNQIRAYGYLYTFGVVRSSFCLSCWTTHDRT